MLREPILSLPLGPGPLFGKHFLLLTHTGRRTGVRHQNGPGSHGEYREEGPEAVVMSGFGRSSDWLRKIEATPNEEDHRRQALSGISPLSE